MLDHSEQVTATSLKGKVTQVVPALYGWSGVLPSPFPAFVACDARDVLRDLGRRFVVQVKGKKASCRGKDGGGE